MGPQSPEFYRAVEEATRLHRAGDYVAAAEVYTKLISRAPRDVQLLRLAGMALREAAYIVEARSLFARAIALAPSDPSLHFEMAILHQADGRIDEAKRSLQTAESLGPGHPACAALLARLLFMEGRFEEAYEAVRPVIDRGDRHPAAVLIFARLARRFGREPEALERLRELAESSEADDGTRAQALFRTGDLLSASKQYDAAFEAYTRANGLIRTAFNPETHAAAIDRLINAWSPQAVAALQPSPCDSDLPVYVVGMPRSGTSLIEQILSMLPGVFAGGERHDIPRTVSLFEHTHHPVGMESPQRLTSAAVRRQSSALLRTYRRLAPGASRFIDKLPDNFLHLGLIARLFPNARVIHCVRDAADTCLSCYFQHFAGYDWVYDLDHLGAYYAGYTRVMQHWRSLAQPLGLRLLDVSYEGLVENPEPEIRRIVDFVGLPWDPVCLGFHESERVVNTASNQQVRQPIYKTSAGRHKHYRKHLGPLLRSLDRLTGPAST